MPSRISPFRAAALHFPAAVAECTRPVSVPVPVPVWPRLFFHTTAPTRRDDIDDKNHYEILRVETDASPADIKKSFYALSKAHHPDHNPDDAQAPRRFVRISEAYGVLSSPERRQRYDRDVLRLQDRAHGHHPHSSPHAHRHGSYSSTGPAGGRPASGLSRRRGTFRGPPPSFYRSGGWGAHGAKRSAAHEESTGGGGGGAAAGSGGGSSDAQSSSETGSGYNNYGGGMGPGQEPFGRGSAAAASEMPHFDQAAQAMHTRTQARNDERRARRLAREYHFPGTSDFGEVGSFFAILGVLGVAVGLPYLVLRGWNRGEEKRKKKRPE